MASVSSTSSLGNTSLRGFGGMASGIDRDAIIEKMTLGTTTKINSKKQEVTKLQWKQEAYRSMTDQILDLSDKYASYTSTTNLKDPLAFAKNIISVHGREDATRFVSATGTSDLINNVSITGVKQLATSSVLQSAKHVSADGITTKISNLGARSSYQSNLSGQQLMFGKDVNGAWAREATFVFKDTYTDESGKEVRINYVPEGENWTKKEGDELAKALNISLEQQNLSLSDEKGSKPLSDIIEFQYNGDKLEIVEKKQGALSGYTLGGKGALLGLGYSGDKASNDVIEGVSLTELSNGQKSFGDSAYTTITNKEALTGRKAIFNFNGTEKEIELITTEEAADKNLTMDQVAKKIQERLDKAFGTGNVKAEYTSGKTLSFTTVDKTASVAIKSNDTDLLNNLGIAYGESNKVNTGGKLDQNQKALGLETDAKGKVDFSQYTVNGTDELDLKINGVEIKGLTTSSTIDDILSKINSTTAAGVKATYVDATGQFMLVSSETGKGREIDVSKDGGGSALADKLFGAGAADDPNKGTFVEGQNAQIEVSYGNGITVNLERASNTFNLEGLSVTVSGVFGGDWEELASGDTYDANDPNYKEVGGKKYKWNADSSETVTFTAKADVDGITEKVKSFFEDFNALVTEINSQVTTRPDSSYAPLTDEQKDEMDETSIENWEKKAKQGLLYGDSIMRDMSMDVQSIFTKMMSNGASYEDLKKIGITYSEDWGDGGVLVFDESAFRSAMETDPDLVSNIFTGGGDVKKGLINTVDETFTPYATRYASKNPGNTYGRLIEIAGTEKKPSTLMNNDIYKQLKEMQEQIEKLQDQLKIQEDRYISQFTTMESLINQFNTQSSYLSQITG